MPKFSIIIPLYNAERYIGQCLDSIAEQSYPDFEVIIVDDGSTDNGALIAKMMTERDPRFVYYYKENGGVSSARNLGIDKAKGEWISFVDADDYINPDYLQTFVDTNPKADITFFGETSFYPNAKNTEKVPETGYYACRKDVEKAIYYLSCGPLGDVFGWTWDKFLRGSIIREHNVRFADNISFREDEVFAFEYCRYVTSLRIIGKKLYNYRILDSGLTGAGMRKSDLLPSSERLEACISHYSHPGLCEKILSSVTNYRALDIYASPLRSLSLKLQGYEELMKRHPQPGIEYKVNHLTQYLKKSRWLGYFYCLIRKI